MAMLLASVVRTARRAGSKARNTGAEERASFSASKLAWVSAVQVNSAVGLPSAVSGAATSAKPSTKRRQQMASPVKRRTSQRDVGVAHSTMDRHALCRESVAEEAELLPPELALGALGIELPAAEDLEHLGVVEQMLFQRRQVHQTI